MDDADIEQVLGARAHRTLTRTCSPLPSVADLRHTLDVLDRLGPRRTPTDDDAGSPFHDRAAHPLTVAQVADRGSAVLDEVATLVVACASP